VLQQLLESSSVDLCFSEKKPYPYSPVQQKHHIISEKTRWILKSRFIWEIPIPNLRNSLLLEIRESKLNCHNYPVAHPDYQWHIGGFPFSTNH
jgi:hypothetical protein